MISTVDKQFGVKEAKKRLFLDVCHGPHCSPRHPISASLSDSAAFHFISLVAVCAAPSAKRIAGQSEKRDLEDSQALSAGYQNPMFIQEDMFFQNLCSHRDKSGQSAKIPFAAATK